MTPLETLLGAVFFATIVTAIVNGIISAYEDEKKNEGEE
jgi:hypothetical protein